MERIPKCLYTPEFRAEAVILVMGSGLSVDAAAKRLSVPKNSLGNWVRAPWNGKLAKVGQGLRLPTDAEVELARLNAEQEEAIQRTICDKRPEQLKMEFALWTRGEVLLFIEQEYGVKLSIRAVGDYLKCWGFTPQKPIKRAYEQRPEAVKQWLDQEYPSIEKRAKAEAGEIHWGDETALVNTDVRGRSYAPKGQTPVTMAVGGSRQKLSMISTVTNQPKNRSCPILFA